MLDQISWMTDLCQNFTLNGTFKFDQKWNCPLSKAQCPLPPLEFTTTHPPLTQRWKCSLEWNSCRWSLVEVTSFTSNMDFRNYMEFLRSNMSGYLGNLHKSLLSTLHLIFLDMREGMIGGWISVCVNGWRRSCAWELSACQFPVHLQSDCSIYIYISSPPTRWWWWGRVCATVC